MRKNSFIEGTIVATLGILLVKVIGLVYVIPFHAIIGETGGALYGYGYNIYQLFLSISTAGFPFAISKLTSEYNTLGYKQAMRDTYKVAMQLISIISIVIFIMLFIFAPQIGHIILGKNAAINDYQEVGFVIRCVSFAILVVPFLSVTRGFLQGHKYITPYSTSQIVEQIVRVIVLLVGSYTFINIFHLELKYAIGISVGAAFFGGLVAYLYLRKKILLANLLPKTIKEDPVKIGKKEIIHKIFLYSIPFILISIINNLYNTVDMVLLNNTMKDILHFDKNTIESISGIYTTWGIKLNNIILAVSTGLVTSLIPNIVSSFTKKDIDDVNDKFNKALGCVLLVIVPMTIYMSLLAEPIWTLFYGKSTYGPIVFKYFVYTALFGGIYTIMVNTLQGINKYKLVTITVLMGLLTNAILDVPFMLLFNKLGMNVSYGAITAALIGYGLSSTVSLTILHKKYKFSFKATIQKIPNYIIGWVTFITIIYILKIFIPTNITNRMLTIPVLAIYGIISFAIYIYINYKTKIIKDIFGDKINNNLKKVLK